MSMVIVELIFPTTYVLLISSLVFHKF